MKKLISLVLALVMCLSVCGVVYAAEDDFVPSISYKDGPRLVLGMDGAGKSTVGAVRDASGNVIGYVYYEDCLVITTIAQALKNVETGIPDDAELLLEKVYRDILNGTAVLPFENPDEMVVIQLIDATFLCAGAEDQEDHPEILEPNGIRMELTFDLGVDADVPVQVMTYKNDQWGDIYAVTNNGDGTVTCVFEHLCPIAFAVPADAVENTPATGDDSVAELGLWIGLLAASSVALAGLVIFRRKVVR